LQAEESNPTAYVHREFMINAALLSYLPGQQLDSYKSPGGGTAQAGSSLGLGMSIKNTPLMVRMHPVVKAGRFLVTVEIEPEAAKKALAFETQTRDLTDLKPIAIQISAAENDRVYQLNIIPSVQISDFTPKPLKVADLQLQNWRFPDSPIHVNDSIYVGRLSCAQSPVAFVDISGVANIKFSLYHLKGAKPWGALKEGVVTIKNPDEHTTIEIANVQNGGPHSMNLPGGPYQVWVGWSKPTHTIDQHRQELSELRKRIADGELPGASLDLLDQQIARPPAPWLYSGGVRGIERGERADEKKTKAPITPPVDHVDVPEF
jgi:hypothetical protein